MSKYIAPIKQKDMKPETLAFVKRMGQIAYPGYKGRKWTVRYCSNYQMENYWDGGSKTYSTAIDLSTLKTSQPGANTTNPFNKAAHASFEIPMGFAIVENCIFMGKPTGITLVIRYDETKVPGLFPALPEPEETIQIEG